MVGTPPSVRLRRNNAIPQNRAQLLVGHRLQPALVAIENGLFIAISLLPLSPTPNVGMQLSLLYFMLLRPHLETSNPTPSHPARRNEVVLIDNEPAKSLLLDQPQNHIEDLLPVVDLGEAKYDVPPTSSDRFSPSSQASEPYESQQSLSPRGAKIKQERRGNPDNFGRLDPRIVEPVYRARLILFKEEDQAEADQLPSELARTQLLSDQKGDLNLENKHYDLLGLLQFDREVKGLTIQYERKCFKVDVGPHIDVYPNLNFLSNDEQKKIGEYDSNQHAERRAQERVKREAEEAEREAKCKARLDAAEAKSKADLDAAVAESKAELDAVEAEAAAKCKAEGEAQQARLDAKQKELLAKFDVQFEEFVRDASPENQDKVLAEFAAEMKVQKQKTCPESNALGATGIFSPQHIASVSQRRNTPSCQQEAILQQTTTDSTTMMSS
ncbi:MAG: hypothetical protein K0Q74_1670 [Gammaproteobacteria bacterium]|nr:hypothetical protein [Gammaproteobacteria bacterium]